MHLPVLAAPVLARAALVAAWSREGAIGSIAAAVFVVGIAGGGADLERRLRLG